jgi:hypothetical protein
MEGHKIQKLPEDLFEGVSNLRWILLTDNLLSSLPEKLFDGTGTAIGGNLGLVNM